MTLLFTFSFLLYYFISWMRTIFKKSLTKKSKAAMMIFCIITMILGIYPALHLMGIYLIAEIVLIIEFALTIFLYVYDKKTGINKIVEEFGKGEISPFEVWEKANMKVALIISFLGLADTIASIIVIINMITNLL